MADSSKQGDRNSMRHPDQQESRLASTREDATLAEQILDDSPHPDPRVRRGDRHRER
jgi:hypothetical protein